MEGKDIFLVDVAVSKDDERRGRGAFATDGEEILQGERDRLLLGRDRERLDNFVGGELVTVRKTFHAVIIDPRKELELTELIAKRSTNGLRYAELARGIVEDLVGEFVGAEGIAAREDLVVDDTALKSKEHIRFAFERESDLVSHLVERDLEEEVVLGAIRGKTERGDKRFGRRELRHILGISDAREAKREQEEKTRKDGDVEKFHKKRVGRKGERNKEKGREEERESESRRLTSRLRKEEWSSVEIEPAVGFGLTDDPRGDELVFGERGFVEGMVAMVAEILFDAEERPGEVGIRILEVEADATGERAEPPDVGMPGVRDGMAESVGGTERENRLCIDRWIIVGEGEVEEEVVGEDGRVGDAGQTEAVERMDRSNAMDIKRDEIMDREAGRVTMEDRERDTRAGSKTSSEIIILEEESTVATSHSEGRVLAGERIGDDEEGGARLYAIVGEELVGLADDGTEDAKFVDVGVFLSEIVGHRGTCLVDGREVEDKFAVLTDGMAEVLDKRVEWSVGVSDLKLDRFVLVDDVEDEIFHREKVLRLNDRDMDTNRIDIGGACLHHSLHNHLGLRYLVGERATDIGAVEDSDSDIDDKAASIVSARGGVVVEAMLHLDRLDHIGGDAEAEEEVVEAESAEVGRRDETVGCDEIIA